MRNLHQPAPGSSRNSVFHQPGSADGHPSKAGPARPSWCLRSHPWGGRRATGITPAHSSCTSDTRIPNTGQSTSGNISLLSLSQPCRGVPTPVALLRGVSAVSGLRIQFLHPVPPPQQVSYLAYHPPPKRILKFLNSQGSVRPRGGPSKSPNFKAGMWADKTFEKHPRILAPKSRCQPAATSFYKCFSGNFELVSPPRAGATPHAPSSREAPQPHLHPSCSALLLPAPITSSQAPRASLILLLPRHSSAGDHRCCPKERH